MGMMFRRNKLRRKAAEEHTPVQKPEPGKQTESVKDMVPEPKRRGRKPKDY